MRETAVLFGAQKSMVGVVSDPAPGAAPTIGCILLNAGFTHHIGPQRAYVLLARELAPVLTAVLIAGRVGSAFAAEIGTMQVTERGSVTRSKGLEQWLGSGSGKPQAGRHGSIAERRSLGPRGFFRPTRIWLARFNHHGTSGSS